MALQLSSKSVPVARTLATRVGAVALALAALSAAPPAGADYPLVSYRYLADPGSLVSGGRVYLYNSNDDDNPAEGDYSMKSIVCISSRDLKNWTDHGEVLRVPMNASWANFSWAPAAVERDGKIFMYFGNNANGVGVASSTSPTGPFVDAKGSALVDSSTPGAAGTDSWLFDPSVFIDDDGQAYLTFGGNGDNNARIIRLNDDMISVSGSAIALSIENFFEASWLHKRGDDYYFSYSTNSSAGLRIDYLMSKSPTSGYTYAGVAADQPPTNGNNNHHSIFEFEGKWYHAYHNRIVSTEAGIPTTLKRNLAIDTIDYAADGKLVEVEYTTDGIVQLESLNPYVRVEAETTNAQNGIETEPASAGGMAVTEIDDGDWIRVRGVDFGSSGAKSFRASVAAASGGGSIELRLDSLTGTLLGTCSVPATGGAETWMDSTCDVAGATGVKDLYLKFGGGGFSLDHWAFVPVDGGAGSGGSAGSAGSSSGGSAVGGSGGSTATGGGGVLATGGASSPGATGGVSNGAAAGTAGSSSGGAPSTGGTVAGRGGALAQGGSGGVVAAPAGNSGQAATAPGAGESGCGCVVVGSQASRAASISLFLAGLVLSLWRRAARTARAR